MDPINSDDWDFGEPPKDPWAHAGAASIAKMIENKDQDRFDSKRAVLHLRHARSNPRAEYSNALWHNRFLAFRLHTLGDVHARTVAPTGRQIERFLFSIVRHVNPQPSDNPIPSFAWIKSGYYSLRQALDFHYSDFKLSRHDSVRIDSQIETLVQQGLLTKKAKRDQHWLSVHLMKSMVRKLYINALEHGTRFWDMTLANAQQLVVFFALGARAGDVSKDKLDRHELPFLAYKDVTIKILGDGPQDMVMDINLRNLKGYKGTDENNQSAFFGHLANGPAFLDPTLVVLVMALRTGNIAATSIQQLVAETRARPNHTVHWVHPNWPVFPAFAPKGLLRLGTPANSKQINTIMAKAALRVGIVSRITSHDSRRGAAQGLHNLSKDNAAAAFRPLEAVRRGLMHSKTADMAGITQAYVGKSTVDFWSLRVQDDFVHPFDNVAITRSGNEPPSDRRRSSEEIDALCSKYGLDAANRTDRHKAGLRAQEEELEQWRKQEIHALNQPIDHGEDRVDPDDEHEHVCDDDEDDGDSDEESASENDDQNDDGDSATEELGSMLTKFTLESRTSDNDDDTDTLMVDAAMLDFLSSQEPPESSQQAVMSAGDLLESLRGFDFIDHFSRINTMHAHVNTVRRARRRWDAQNSNSRDRPSYFRIACKNARFGCDYNSRKPDLLVNHEAECALIDKEAQNQAELAKENRFTCPRPGCSRTFITQGKVNTHVKNIHDFKAVPCPHGCNPEKLHATYITLESHIQDYHTDFQATTCPISSCSSSYMFTIRSRLRTHLSNVHSLSGNDITTLIDNTQPTKDDGIRFEIGADGKFLCPNQGCNRTFPELRRVRTHVQYDHDFTPIPCPHGCNPLKLYGKKGTVQSHIRNIHNFRETSCPLAQVCSSKKVFNSRLTLSNHLSKTHKLSGKELTDHIRQTQPKSLGAYDEE